MPSYLHSGDLGDIIFALPIIRKLGAGPLYFTSGFGTREAMTEPRINFIRPVLLAQPYVTAVEAHKGQKVSHDFTGFREGYVTDVPVGVIQNRHVAPFARADFKTPWLSFADAPQHGRPVFSRTERYNNPDGEALWRKIVARCPNALFVGTKAEHERFEATFKAGSELVPISTGLDTARAIAGASIFCGNQSFANSIAEGMKIKRIVEHCVKQPDAFWPDENAVRLHKLADWPFGGESAGLVFALQVSPHEIEQAREMARLIVDIEKEPRGDVEFCLAIRDDVDANAAAEIEAILKQRFPAFTLRSKRYGRGWPDGCNDLWQSTMMQLGQWARGGKTKCEAVVTFEPDCIPLRLDWINRLKQEWVRVRDLGKMAFGTVHDAGGTAGLHINGNMVLDIHAIKRFPQLQSSHGCWDCFHAKLFLENGVDSPTIIQRYGERRDLTPEDFAGFRSKGGDEVPAFIHGIKAMSRFDAVRSFLFGPAASASAPPAGGKDPEGGSTPPGDQKPQETGAGGKEGQDHKTTATEGAL